MSIISLAFAVVAIGFVAGLVPLFFDWTHRDAHRWIGFGAGTILGAAFLHILPEAFELAGARGLPAALVGFLMLYVIEQLLLRHPHDEAAGAFHEVGLLTFIGFAVHDFVDGVALGTGGHVPDLTPALFLALALHKVPTMFALSLLMVHGGLRKPIVAGALASVLLAIPLGAVVSDRMLAFVGGNPERAVGLLLQFSAGTFLYIGAYELLPEMHRKSERGAHIGLFFAAGLMVMVLLKLLPHAH
jgi:zinc and cadmium transporter